MKKHFRIAKRSIEPSHEKVRSVIEQRLGKVTTFFPRTKIEELEDKSPTAPDE